MERHPVADEIEKRMKEKGTSPKRLALDAGLGATYVRDILAGNSLDPKAGKLSRIAAVLGCTLEDLLPSSGAVKSGLQPVMTEQIVVRGQVQAGVWRDALEWPPSDFYTITAPVNPMYASLPRYALEVRGASMDRIFPDGSVVVVINFGDLGRRPQTGELVVAVQRSARTEEFEATVKAYQEREDGTIVLWPQSSDPEFATAITILPSEQTHEVGSPDVTILGLVVASYRPNPRVTF